MELILQLTALMAVSIIKLCNRLYRIIILSTPLASITSFCRVTQDGCAYQYFVGTSGVTFTSEDTIVEVMEAGKGQYKNVYLC